MTFTTTVFRKPRFYEFKTSIEIRNPYHLRQISLQTATYLAEVRTIGKKNPNCHLGWVTCYYDEVKYALFGMVVIAVNFADSAYSIQQGIANGSNLQIGLGVFGIGINSTAVRNFDKIADGLANRLTNRAARRSSALLQSGDDIVGNRFLNTGRANRPVTTIDDLLSSNITPGQAGVVLNQRTVVFDDIYRLSFRDSAEYVLTREGGRYVLRSGLSNKVGIPPGIRPIVHTHPADSLGFVDKLPSRADSNALNFIWARNPNGPRPVSQIITGLGETTPFRATGLDKIP